MCCLGTTSRCVGACGLMSGKPMQHSSSYTRFAGIVPETILQNRQSEEESEVASVFIFIIKSTSDARPLPRGCKPRQTPHGLQLRGGSRSRSRRKDAAQDHPARSRPAFETPAVS